MKRLSLSLFCMVSFLLVSAQDLKDGFYRARNTVTGRYITVTDDYGRIDVASTSADLGAIQTWKSFDNVVSNPASVIYSEYNASVRGYRLYCQGTDTYQIISNYLSMIKPDDDLPQLWIYAKKSGMVAYLCDEYNEGLDSSYVEKYTTDKIADTRLWDALPLSTSGDNYFGMKPTLSYGGAYYLSFMASFPFSLYSQGINIYYVNQIDVALKVAVLKEIGKDKSDIPGGTPLIAKCSSQSPSDNRLDIHASSSKAPSDNLLKGVYFMKRVGRTERLADQNPHTDVVQNDTATMRVIGVLSDGSLGMKVYGGKYMPKNSSYLSVPANSPRELKLVSAEEYEKMKVVKVSSIVLDKTSLDLELNSSATLTATVLPSNATNKSVTWTTSEPSVATVSEGIVKAVGEGDAVITVSANDGSGVKAQCTVHCYVPAVKVSSIILGEPSLSLEVGSEATVMATVLPEAATNKVLSWSSSNAYVATVSDGKVVATGVGEAMITATATDGSGVFAQCEVRCYEKEILVQSIMFDKSFIRLPVDSVAEIKATVLPANATNRILRWDTSNGQVASVSGGVITAKGEGLAVVSAYATDGSGVFAECEVEAYKVVDGINCIETNSERQALIFDLSGRRYSCGMESLAPGIYIVNGFKVLVK